MSLRSTRRRLAAIEEALSPTGVVLRWLAEGKAHGSMAGYAEALAQGQGALDPFEQFVDLLEPAVGPRESDSDTERARWRKVRQALVRYFLVVRINLHAAELGPLLNMTALANSYHLDALIAGGTGAEAPLDGDAERDPGWPTWRERSEWLLTELYADQFARVSSRSAHRSSSSRTSRAPWLPIVWCREDVLTMTCGDGVDRDPRLDLRIDVVRP